MWGEASARGGQPGNPKASVLFQLVGQHRNTIPKEVQGMLFLSVSLVPGWKMSSWEDLIWLVLGRADPILSSSIALGLGPALLVWRVPVVAAEVLGLAQRQALS